MRNTTREIDPEGGGTTTAETNTGMDENVAGALSYLFGLLTGILFYVIDDRRFVKFHAAQSIAVFGLLFVAYVAMSILQIVITGVMLSGSTGGFIVGSIISLVLGLIWLVMALGGFVLWIYLLVRAYQGSTPRIPIAAGIADKMV